MPQALMEQIGKASETFIRLSNVINSTEAVITYGNGPQIGEIYHRCNSRLTDIDFYR